jgi:transposase
VRGKVKSKVELFEQIRIASRDEKLGIHALSKRFKVHRRDVRAALLSAEPPERKQGSWPSPLTGPHHEWIREILRGDLTAPAKQRHTAKRIRDRLAEEKNVLVGESTCRTTVAKLRAEVAGEQKSFARIVFVPQTRLPGAEAEVDWGKFTAVIGGVSVTLSLFSMWLGFSSRAFHRAYVNEAQESFTDAHVRAFQHFGGVPRMVRYDNLKTAAIKILQGRSRIENARFTTLRSHYGFESFFCEPGIKGAHEKGGTEADIGKFRRNHLVPVPTFDTLHDLNVYISKCDLVDDARFVVGRNTGHPSAGESVLGLWVFEQGAMWMLPTEAFNAVTRLSVRVDTKARVCVRNCFYSVPARYVDYRLNVELGAETVTIIGPAGKQVAHHQRALHRKTEVLDLDHYLEVLWKRPGGFPGSTALAQARTSGRFRPEHQQFWDTARRMKGDRDGTRLLCEILLLHRTHTTDEIVAGIRAALAINSIDPGVIAIEARRSIEHTETTPRTTLMERPPSLADYDNLLNRKNQP